MHPLAIRLRVSVVENPTRDFKTMVAAVLFIFSGNLYQFPFVVDSIWLHTFRLLKVIKQIIFLILLDLMQCHAKVL